MHWAKKTGFDLVFALNNDEKTSSGMWDPNTALKILTVADKANIGEIFWQLGYGKCFFIFCLYKKEKNGFVRNLVVFLCLYVLFRICRGR